MVSTCSPPPFDLPLSLIGLRLKHQYVGVAPDVEVSDEDFKDQFEALNEELETLNEQARGLESTIARNAAEILES
jgi:hypothetical protein